MTQATFPFDAIISCRHSDAARVLHELLPRLQGARRRV